jgi:hypothetical protein
MVQNKYSSLFLTLVLNHIPLSEHYANSRPTNYLVLTYINLQSEKSVLEKPDTLRLKTKNAVNERSCHFHSIANSLANTYMPAAS